MSRNNHAYLTRCMAALAALLTLASCIKDDLSQCPPDGPETATLRLRLSMPGGMHEYVESRAEEAADGDTCIIRCIAELYHKGVEKIILPETCTTIGKNAFYASTIKTIVAPGVKVVAVNGFCSAETTSITLGDVTSTGDYAFAQINGMTLDLTQCTSVPTFSSNHAFYAHSGTACTVIVPDALKESFESALASYITDGHVEVKTASEAATE